MANNVSLGVYHPLPEGYNTAAAFIAADGLKLPRAGGRLNNVMPCVCDMMVERSRLFGVGHDPLVTSGTSHQFQRNPYSDKELDLSTASLFFEGVYKTLAGETGGLYDTLVSRGGFSSGDGLYSPASSAEPGMRVVGGVHCSGSVKAVLDGLCPSGSSGWTDSTSEYGSPDPATFDAGSIEGLGCLPLGTVFRGGSNRSSATRASMPSVALYDELIRAMGAADGVTVSGGTATGDSSLPVPSWVPKDGAGEYSSRYYQDLLLDSDLRPGATQIPLRAVVPATAAALVGSLDTVCFCSHASTGAASMYTTLSRNGSVERRIGGPAFVWDSESGGLGSWVFDAASGIENGTSWMPILDPAAFDSAFVVGDATVDDGPTPSAPPQDVRDFANQMNLDAYPLLDGEQSSGSADFFLMASLYYSGYMISTASTSYEIRYGVAVHRGCRYVFRVHRSTSEVSVHYGALGGSKAIMHGYLGWSGSGWRAEVDPSKVPAGTSGSAGDQIPCGSAQLRAAFLKSSDCVVLGEAAIIGDAGWAPQYSRYRARASPSTLHAAGALRRGWVLDSRPPSFECADYDDGWIMYDPFAAVPSTPSDRTYVTHANYGELIRIACPDPSSPSGWSFSTPEGAGLVAVADEVFDLLRDETPDDSQIIDPSLASDQALEELVDISLGGGDGSEAPPAGDGPGPPQQSEFGDDVPVNIRSLYSNTGVYVRSGYMGYSLRRSWYRAGLCARTWPVVFGGWTCDVLKMDV